MKTSGTLRIDGKSLAGTLLRELGAEEAFEVASRQADMERLTRNYLGYSEALSVIRGALASQAEGTLIVLY